MPHARSRTHKAALLICRRITRVLPTNPSHLSGTRNPRRQAAAQQQPHSSRWVDPRQVHVHRMRVRTQLSITVPVHEDNVNRHF
jgi:hypothetical protein